MRLSLTSTPGLFLASFVRPSILSLVAVLSCFFLKDGLCGHQAFFDFGQQCRPVCDSTDNLSDGRHQHPQTLFAVYRSIMALIKARTVLPNIPAPSSPEFTQSPLPSIPFSSDHIKTSVSPSILAAPSSAFISSTGPSPTAAIPSRPTSSASSTPNPAPHHGTSAAKIAAIVVPIVAVILIIPLIFLLFRSHQIKKAEERRRSQRSSGEAMLQRPSSISKGEAPQIAQQSFGGTGNTSSPRPTNSLGLFNFDFGPLKSPSLLSPASPRSPARPSVAHAVSVRRSQPHVVNARGSAAAPSNHRTSRQSQHSMLLSDPVPPYTAEEASDPHFAPLNSIGIAHTRSNSRPTFQRQPSSGAVSALSRPSDAYGYGHARASSPGVLPPIPNGALNWGGRFTVSDYDRIDRRSEISALSESEYSDDHDRRISQQSQITVKDNGGMQPHRII